MIHLLASMMSVRTITERWTMLLKFFVRLLQALVVPLRLSIIPKRQVVILNHMLETQKHPVELQPSLMRYVSHILLPECRRNVLRVGIFLGNRGDAWFVSILLKATTLCQMKRHNGSSFSLWFSRAVRRLGFLHRLMFLTLSWRLRKIKRLPQKGS